MTRREKMLVRLAIAIHERLQRATTSNIELPTLSWQQCEYWYRKMRQAQERGWHLAAQRL